MSTPTVTVTAYVMPAGTVLSPAAPYAYADGTVLSGGGVTVTSSFPFTIAANSASWIAGNLVPDFNSSVSLTGTPLAAPYYITAFIGYKTGSSPTGLSQTTLVLSNTNGPFPLTLGTPFNTPAGFTIAVSSGTTLEVDFLGDNTTPTQVLALGFEYTPLDNAVVVNAGEVSGYVALQAVVAGTSRPPNCLSGGVRVLRAVDSVPVALRDCGSLVTVEARAPDGRPCAVPATVVRSVDVGKVRAPCGALRFTGCGPDALVSWSHVLLAPAGGDPRKPAHQWRCATCRAAGVYDCPVCAPVACAGHEPVMACDAAQPAVLTPTTTLGQPWYHLVPVDPADATKVFVLPDTSGPLLSEFFRTPLEAVLAAGEFAVAPPASP
jgi:hypothetical protein